MSISKFLTESFDAQKGNTLIAGRGIYPKIVANNAKKAGVKVNLIALEDETESDLFDSFAESERVKINIGQLGALLKNAKKFQSPYAIMAGQVRPKRLFDGLKPDLKAMLILATLKEKNAESIFGAIAKELSKIGVELVDARSFMDNDLATSGFMNCKKWNISQNTFEHGLKIVRECARLNIGQACVVANGTTLAVEGFDGTDNMIERCAQFKAKEMLFLKTVKANQDYRFDVPVIGERTLLKLSEAGIQNVAVESEKVLMLNKESLLQYANSLNIKIFGI